MTTAERLKRNALNEEMAEERRIRLRNQRLANQRMRQALAEDWQEQTRPEREAREAEERAEYHAAWLDQGREFLALLEKRLTIIELRIAELSRPATKSDKKRGKNATSQD